MSTIDYELHDVMSSTMLISTTEKHDFIEALKLIFDQVAVADRLDNLVVMVYHADSETEMIAGAEEIDSWLTANE